MPEMQLIVASGGEQLDHIREIARDASNITVLGWVNDDELVDLVSNALATIYIPSEEDFGMSPVESMAAGKPVIGVAEGGLLETVVHNQTGILLRSNPSAHDIIKAVQSMTKERAYSMRFACEQRATLFSKQRFIENMNAIIGACINSADRD
ncbi:MAG: hypothetical protein Rhirs2KO_13980 [Rhizobiaceae bacterium]